MKSADDRSVSPNTQYSTYNGRLSSQTVIVSEPSGKVTTTLTINGKLRPDLWLFRHRQA